MTCIRTTLALALASLLGSGGAQAAIPRPDSAAHGRALIQARFDFLHEFNDRQPCDASSPVTAYVPEGAACFA